MTSKTSLGTACRTRTDKGIAGPQSNGSDFKLPVETVSTLTGPLSYGRPIALASEVVIS
jgi:hypothetical protein